MQLKPTERGFVFGEFADRYDVKCSIQKSSLAFEDCIWLGVHDTVPRVLASMLDPVATGWQDVDVDRLLGLPEGSVLISSRMHLTREMVRELLPLLQHFAETGELPES